MSTESGKAYVISVDMGYGHERALHPLLRLSTTPQKWNVGGAKIISANNYPGIPTKDKWVWAVTRRSYELLSRFRGFPIFGRTVFHLINYIERIEKFYPRRDLSHPTTQVRTTHLLIKMGFGKHLIKTLNESPLPMITSFPMPALLAEVHGYKGKIFCLCTDTDISRLWVPLNPSQSRIIYLAPTPRAKERLIMYGVKTENIVVTGFPLPEEAIGDSNTMDTLISSLMRRLAKLDPKGLYHEKYKSTLPVYLGWNYTKAEMDKPLNIMFAIGGAGAQSSIAITILHSLSKKIRENKISLTLVAGTSETIRDIFIEAINSLELKDLMGKSLRIIYQETKNEYFNEFNRALIDTDILWTKPSELAFYAALGIPIIMSPTLGRQEEYNHDWLHMIGAGLEQGEPEYTDEWLTDWLNSGWLAAAAMNGFLNAPKKAVSHIEDLVINNKKSEIEEVHNTK